LVDEYLAVCFVNDTDPGPRQPWLGAYNYYFTVQKVRKQLLEATGLAKKSPTKARRGTKAEDRKDAPP
jgi:hypothetical protein